MSEQGIREPVEIRVRVTFLPNNKGLVDVYIPDGAPFTSLMMAAEYLMNLTAQKSNAGYEKALELLVQGAMAYRRAP